MGTRIRLVGDALSFDDVVLLPGLSPVEPQDVDLSSKASRHVSLATPLVAAPMDTVSEWKMGVAMALLGGIAVVHRNMSVEEQVEHVKKVKTHPPITLRSVLIAPGEECCRVRSQLRRWGLRDAPIVDNDDKIRGRVRLTSLMTCSCGAPVSKYAEPPVVFDVASIAEAKRAVIEGVTDAAAVTLGSRYLGTLIFEDAVAEYHPVLDEEGRLRVAAAISPFDARRAAALDGLADILVSDVAHFHNVNVLSAAARLAKSLESDFIAGNLGTKEGVLDTLTRLERVDGLRMGIAGGNICTTSGVTGVASPTLHAVAEARTALEELGVSPAETPVIADGGIRGSGDAAKALAAGAYSVMAGYLLAGTDEAAAPLLRIGGRLYKPYRGMASRGALERRHAADRYSRVTKNVEEGIEGLVPYRGPVRGVVEGFAEGLRAALGYAGAASIPELWLKARFARITSRIGAYTGTVKTDV